MTHHPFEKIFSKPIARLTITVLVFLFSIFCFGSFVKAEGLYWDYERTVYTRSQVSEINPLTGGFTHSVAIEAPQGRNGLNPGLSLNYNSNDTDVQSIFGAGWSINIPFIQTMNRYGVESMYDDGVYHSSLDGELATTTTSGEYGARFENGQFNKYEFSNDSWTVTDKSGTVYKFGHSTSTRIYDTGTTTTQIYRWLLEEIRDTNDNYIKYEYYHDSKQVYPNILTYTGHDSTDGDYEIEFIRESRNDVATSSFPGIDQVLTNYRISEIKIEFNNSWVKKYGLDYTTGDNGYKSMLNKITLSGRDEDLNTDTLPASIFEYNTKTKTWSEDTDYDVPINFVYGSGAVGGARLVDVNADGMADIVKALYGETRYVYINDGYGAGFTRDDNYTVPCDFHNSGDRGVRFADVNGDGFVDILRSNNVDNDNVYLNDGDGTGWTDDANYSIPVDFVYYNASWTDKGARVVDVNGDGLDDIIFANTTDDKKVYLNDGDGTGWTEDTNYTSIPFAFSTTNEAKSTRLAEINGDGFIDVIYSLGGGNEGVYLNNGNGTGWTEIDIDVPIGLTNSSGQDNGTRMVDINGDGLSDIIKSSWGSSQLTYINDGDGTGWTRNYNYTYPEYFISSGSDQGLRMSDLDGDGQIDFIVARATADKKVFLSDGDKPDLLSTVGNGKGATTTVSYKGSLEYLTGTTTPKNTDAPYSVQTVYQTVTDDGLGNQTTTTFDYEGADYLYNDEYDRRFAGFFKVSATDDDGNVTINYFHQGNTSTSTIGENSDDQSKIGKVFRTERYDDSDNLYTKSIHKWENYEITENRDFVYKSQSVEFAYDGDLDHKDKATTYDYENTYGNLIQSTFWGEVTGSDDGTFTDTGSDYASTTIEYSASTTLHIVGLPKTETTIDQNGDTVKETKYYYDTLSHGEVSKGNVTKEEYWKSGGDYIDIERTYNSYGLVTQEKDPRDKATDFTYDPYNLFVATSTNPLSDTTEFYYDYSLGKPKKTIDANGREFEVVYDGLDRPETEKQPDHDTPTTLITKTEYTYYDSARPRYVKTRQHLNGSDYVDTYTYFDGLDRTIQERTRAEDSNTYTVKDFEYNHYELVKTESLPYFNTGTSRTSFTNDNDLKINYSYDPLKRVTQVVNAVGTTTNAYDQWKLTITDALSNTKDLTKDVYDNLVKVEEHNGVSTYTTEYEYDLQGNLTQIEDALDNVRNFTYDGLGRLLTAEDLHSVGDSYFGTTTYTYDDSGNITTKVDPADQTINYTYDDINRVLTENYTGGAGTEVTYTYDTCTDGKGHLCTAVNSDSTTNYTYYSTGLTKTEAKILNSTTYTTEYDYDRQGNITLITCPDNSEVKYEYNDGGLLEKVSNKESGEGSYTYLMDDFDYNPLGQATFKDFSNDVDSTYTYDADALYRLTNIYTIDPIEDELENKSISVNKFTKEYVLENKLGVEQADGSVVLNTPTEMTKYKTANSDTWLDGFTKEGNRVQSSKLATGHWNYFDSNSKSFKTIDLSLVDGTDQWEMNKARYGAIVKHDLQNEFVSFIHDNQSLSFSIDELPKTTVSGQKDTSSDDWTNKRVTYENALGTNIDLEVKLNNEALIKEVVINNLASLGDLSGLDYYEIPFKLTSNQSIDIVSGEKSLSTEKSIITNESVQVVGGGVTSYVWKPKAVDSSDKNNTRSDELGNRIAIDIEYKLIDGDIYLIKRLPVEWLEGSVFPVRTDATVSYYSGTGDGYIKTGWKVGWSTARDATSGTADDNDSVSNRSAVVEQSGSYYNIYRAFYPVDTSGLDSNISISSATFYFKNGNNTTSWESNKGVELVVSSQASTGSLSNNDFDNVTFTSKGSYTSGNPGSYQWIDIDLTDTSIIDNDGWTKLAVIGTRDLDDSAPSGIQVDVGSYFAESSGTSNDPYLYITYTVLNSAPTAPTSLKIEGATNPGAVKDFTPEFTAVFQDDDSGDTGEYYEIEVATTTTNITNGNTVWDSGKTALSGSLSIGSTSESISYAGSELVSSSTYYWRIKFWDQDDDEGAWSTTTASFTMVPALQNLSYEYDSVGNIVKIIDASDVNSKKATNYTYDDLYRLTQASTTGAVSAGNYLRTYSYNAIGNITNKSDQGNYTYSSIGVDNYRTPHAVSDVNGTTYNYDRSGNLTGDGTWTHAWLYNNRMASSTNGSTVVEYGYDHEGTRVKLDNGSDTFYYPSKYYNVNGATSTKHIFANSQLIATIEIGDTGTSTYYTHTDHLSGSNIITDENGDKIQLIDYYPFGDLRINETDTRFDEKRKFTGHEHDTDTGLNYMLARYQNAGVGRFISKDPWPGRKSDPQTLNKYSYSANNPINYFDPTGEKVEIAYRAVRGTLGVGVHTYLIITPDNPSDFGQKEGYEYTLGGHRAKDSQGTAILEARRNDDYVNAGANNREVIQTPDGMTDTEFIVSIEASFESYDSSAQYDKYSRKGRYNCNNFSTYMIENSGGYLPDDYDPTGWSPGLGETMSEYFSPNQQSLNDTAKINTNNTGSGTSLNLNQGGDQTRSVSTIQIII